MKRQTKIMITWAGFAVWVLSHIYILWKGLPQDMVKTHAWINLIAAGVVYWFMGRNNG